MAPQVGFETTDSSENLRNSALLSESPALFSESRFVGCSSRFSTFHLHRPTIAGWGLPPDQDYFPSATTFWERGFLRSGSKLGSILSQPACASSGASALPLQLCDAIPHSLPASEAGVESCSACLRASREREVALREAGLPHITGPRSRSRASGADEPMAPQELSAAGPSDLVRRIQRGDRSAEGELVPRHRRGIAFILSRSSGNASAADDLLPNTASCATRSRSPPE